LKLLGFSLKEIKEFLRMDAEHFKNRLAQQKAVLKEKIVQINNIIETIENVESALTSNQIDIGAMVRTIQVTQMRLKAEWIKKSLTAEERKTMRELVHQSYSKEALLKLAAKGWTVKDDPPHIQYKIFRERLTDLVNEGIRPDHPEAQKLAKMLMEMNHRLSQDDPSIKEGMKKAWEIFNSLPEAKKPKMYAIPAHERAFLKAACIHYHKNRRKQG
jgi:DNA-binding transcriptional MerR regulator